MNRIGRLCILAWALGSVAVVWADEAQIGAKIDDFALQDYLGATHSLSDCSDKRAVVVVFLGTECPLAKLYGHRLAELAAEFEPKAVQFIGIDSNRQDSRPPAGRFAMVFLLARV